MNRLIKIILISVCSGLTLQAKPIPFDPMSGIVEIDVVINKTIKAKLGIDTGADRFYLDKQFALDNNIEILQANGQKNIQGVHGSTKAYAASISSLDISDNISLPNLSATVVDLKDLSNGTQPPNGLIGYSILKDYFVTVDFPNKTIELLENAPRFLSGRQFIEVPFTSYRHLIIVDVVLNEDITVPMLVDYCASYTTITYDLAQKLGLPIRDDRKAVLPVVDINGAKVENVWTYLSDLKEFKKSNPRAKFEGIIGSSFLYNFNITVDYNKKKIYIRE